MIESTFVNLAILQIYRPTTSLAAMAMACTTLLIPSNAGGSEIHFLSCPRCAARALFS
jgi:hypothetical protein